MNNSPTSVTTQPAHHQWGPSSLKNREVCPGWKSDQSGDKTAADEGTLLHNAAEHETVAGLNAEQAEQVNKCLKYIAPLVKNAIQDHKEVRLVVLYGLTFGTADRVIVRRLPFGSLHIDLVDYKFGRASVDDASENRQGFSYTIAAFDRWPEVDTVTVHFLSPRRDEILKHTFTRKDIPRLSLIISTIISNADLYDRTRDPSMLRLNETNCTWCHRRGKPECPVSVAYMLAHAKKYAPLEIVDEVHSSQITDPAQMGKFYIAIKVLEKMVESGKKHVLEFAKNNEIPGFVRRERKGSVKITNPTLAYPVLKALGLDAEEIASCSQINYGDIQKLISEKATGKKTDAIKKLYNALADVECVTAGEPTEYLQRKKEEAVEEQTEDLAPKYLPAPEKSTESKSSVTGPAVS